MGRVAVTESTGGRSEPAMSAAARNPLAATSSFDAVPAMRKLLRRLIISTSDDLNSVTTGGVRVFHPVLGPVEDIAGHVGELRRDSTLRTA